MKEKDKSVILPLSALFNALCKKAVPVFFIITKNCFN